MKIIKLYVNSEGKAAIECPHCKNARTLHVGKFKGTKRRVKIRCRCQTEFYVSLEFRNATRKEANIRGFYAKLADICKWEKMLVADLSITGVGFLASTVHNLKEGDQVKTRFCLNGSSRSIVEKDAVVRWVADGNIGCEFTEPIAWGDSPDRPLHMYLMECSH